MEFQNCVMTDKTKKLEEGKDGKLKSEMTDNKTMIYGKNNM